MSSFSSLIFTRPKVLHSANRSVLRSFLDPYRDFLTARGVDFEELANPGNGDAFGPLIQTFLSPQADTPAELIDAVFCVSELATPDAVDVLANAAQNLGVKLPANATPAEIAMLLYMASPDVAQALHYERLPLRARAFEYFSTESVTAPVFEPPTTETIQALERSLNIWFEKRRMGCGCRIFNYTRDHETLRPRLGLPEKDYPKASRIIRETIEVGLVKPHDPGNRSRKHAKYLPFWA
jgi:hypothetical protein